MNLDKIEGVQIYFGTTFEDSRGSFSRLYDSEWFPNLEQVPKQVNISRNTHAQTLRGMHFQVTGEPEHKVLTVLSGGIFLTIVDLRKDSNTYLEVGYETLSANNASSIFIPAGCATGWLTLSSNTYIHYLMYSRFELNNYSGLLYNDPYFDIPWPKKPEVISNQDKNWPPFRYET